MGLRKRRNKSERGFDSIKAKINRRTQIVRNGDENTSTINHLQLLASSAISRTAKSLHLYRLGS